MKQKMIIIDGYISTTEINGYLDKGWTVKSVTAVPGSEHHSSPTAFIVIEEEDAAPVKKSEEPNAQALFSWSTGVIHLEGNYAQ